MSKQKPDDRCRACLQAEIDIEQLEQRLANATAEVDRLRLKYEPLPDHCEHGVADGDWCEPCNRAYKEAAAASSEVRGT
jgi:hypothetical protein